MLGSEQSWHMKMLPEEAGGSAALEKGQSNERNGVLATFRPEFLSWSMASTLGFQLRPLPSCICGLAHVEETSSSSRVTKPGGNDILNPNQHCPFARTPWVLRVYYKGQHWANSLGQD